MERKAILVVEADAAERDRMSAWLDEAGFEAIVCPGPTGPEFVCVGGRGKPCPLAHPADIVVLDPWLASDGEMVGTSAGELLAFYLSSGKSVVILGRGDAPLGLFAGEPMALLERRPDRESLIRTVRSLIQRLPTRGKENEG